MTTPPSSASVLGVSTALALGVVLMIGSCEVPVPRAREGVIIPRVVEPESQDETLNILNIRVDPNGSIRMNDVQYPMASVSAVVGPLHAASEGTFVVSIIAHRDVPYGIMDQLQQELVAAGALRVVFRTVDSLTPELSSEYAPTLWDQGLAMALRAVRAVYEALESLATRSAKSDVAAPADQGLAMVLPEPGGAVQVNPRSVMHLTVLPDGIVAIRRGESPQAQAISPRDVASVWRQDVAENPRLIASVETHPDTPYRYMVEVLDALHSAKAERISLTVLEN